MYVCLLGVLNLVRYKSLRRTVPSSRTALLSVCVCVCHCVCIIVCVIVCMCVCHCVCHCV
jgi:hypothetical protein